MLALTASYKPAIKPLQLFTCNPPLLQRPWTVKRSQNHSACDCSPRNTKRKRRRPVPSTNWPSRWEARPELKTPVQKSCSIGRGSSRQRYLMESSNQQPEEQEPSSSDGAAAGGSQVHRECAMAGATPSTSWLLMTPVLPFRYSSTDSKSKEGRPPPPIKKITEPYPFCWALDPSNGRWMPLALPGNFIGTIKDPARVFALSGSCGLVVCCRGFKEPIVVGNPMTSQWMPPIPPNKDASKLQSIDLLAIELVMDEEGEGRRAVKLLQFCKHIGDTSSSMAVTAFSYCFRQEKWEKEASIQFPGRTPKNFRTKAGACLTHHGAVFFLVSGPGQMKFLVLAYCISRKEFGRAVPPTTLRTATFARWQNCALAVIPDHELQPDPEPALNPDDTGPGTQRRAQESRRRRDMAKMPAPSTVDSLMGSIMDSSIRLVLGRWYESKKQDPLIAALRYDRTSGKWELQDRARIKRQNSGGGPALRKCVCKKVSTKPGSLTAARFEMADAGAGAVYVAAFFDACTHVGLYTLSTQEYGSVGTPLLPVGLHDAQAPAPYWTKFWMHAFRPSREEPIPAP